MRKDNFKDFLLITIGILLVAISVVYFFEPNNIAAGGITGLAIVINHYIPFISIGPLVLIMDATLFVIALVVIGPKFGAKSIYCSFLLSTSMWVMQKFFPFTITNDLMLATIFGTLIAAAGMAIVFNANASSGGTDIIAKILNKFFHFNIGKSLLMVDFLVTLLGAITFGINIGLYGLLSVIVNGVVIDKIIAGFKVKSEITIISNRNKEISQYILNDLERGCTFIKGVGGFTGKDTSLLYTVLDRSEFIKLKNHISSIDKNAFITVGEVHEVMGEGFKGIDED
ncbi:YitT family protein [Clostridium saudiense]|uniref:YitT family protein n=1 Tax=Clostridium saudiense TaxID=1414720 RepID=A0ABS2FD36_9CLOT|nr:YitT family protein [Clostridium saudiense]MBM6817848.1 YitT family protein [Clostridium saudiense]